MLRASYPVRVILSRLLFRYGSRVVHHDAESVYMQILLGVCVSISQVGRLDVGECAMLCMLVMEIVASIYTQVCWEYARRKGVHGVLL